MTLDDRRLMLFRTPNHFTGRRHHHIVRCPAYGHEHVIGQGTGRERNKDKYGTAQREKEGIDSGFQGSLKFGFHGFYFVVRLTVFDRYHT